MKHLITLSIIFTLSNTAFATHAYRGENCTSTNYKLNYNGNYPVGGLYGISLKGLDEETKALPLNDLVIPSTLEYAEVIFTEVSSKIIKKSKISSDCGFEHEEWRSKKSILINLISDEASLKLKLKKGDKILFTCNESADYPDGSECK
jgi:hypothetical protein